MPWILVGNKYVLQTWVHLYLVGAFIKVVFFLHAMAGNLFIS